MGTNSDYDALVSQRNSAQRKHDKAAAIKAECDYNLRRLRPVKRIISDQKNQFRYYVKLQDEHAPDYIGSWVGKNCSDFKNKADDVILEDGFYYQNALDTVLDAINDEITRLENLKAKQVAIIGNLVSLLNSLANEIENFFN